MFKGIGQFLTVLAVMASALNAQCSLACSLKSSSPVAVTQRVESGHECCPDESAPAPGQDKRGTTCSDPLVTVSDAVSVNTVHLTNDFGSLIGVHAGQAELFIPASRPLLFPSYLRFRLLCDRHAFSILRL